MAARRRAELRAEFSLDTSPNTNEVVQVMLDDAGEATIVTAVLSPGAGWLDPRTALPLLGDVVGWRRHPFSPPSRPEDPWTWSDEDLVLELATLFAEDTGEVCEASADRLAHPDADLDSSYGEGRASPPHQRSFLSTLSP